MPDNPTVWLLPPSVVKSHHATAEGRVKLIDLFRRRARIEHSASVKFDRGAVEPDGRTVLIKVFDLI